jgi:hypothetical protein
MVVKGNGNFKRTKHIKNRYFFIKQFIDGGLINVVYLSTHKMVADVLTKVVNGMKFHDFMRNIFGEIG